MSQSTTLYSGMDVHKDSIAVASVAKAHDAAGVFRGTMGTRHGASDQRSRRLPSKAHQLLCVYEAGPCGDWLSRDLTQTGDDGWGVAPSLIPTTPGDRVTTDRRDAIPLARLARAGALTVVDVPQGAADAMRDRMRAREETLGARPSATRRLKACLLRHDRRHTGRATWGPAHRRWLAAVVCPTPAPPSGFHEDVRAIPEPPARLPRLDQARQAHVPSWRLPPVVEALPARRGTPGIAAVPMVAAMGELPRFEHPRALLNCLGLMPAAYTRAARRRQGAMTNAGHPHARRALVAGAWADRDPAQGSRHVPRRRAQPPQTLPDIRGTAPGRRCQRSRPRRARGQHANVVPVALARELAGFLWAMATPVPVTPEGHDRSRLHDALTRLAHVHRTRRRPGVGSPSAA
jgi:transposase